MMRVLSVRQPWAHAIIHLGKDVENRKNRLTGGYTGPLAIQAGLQYNDGAEAMIEAIRPDLKGSAWLSFWPLPQGVIIGVVDLVAEHDCDLARGCHKWIGKHPVRWDGGDLVEDGPTICSDWAEVPEYDDVIRHLTLANPRPLSEPLPWKGSLGLGKPTPPEVEAIEMLVAR